MRVRIDYSDQNEAFAPLLPVAGELERLIPSPDKRKWWIVKLDKPLEYQRKIGEPFRYQLVRAEFLVVAADGKATRSVNRNRRPSTSWFRWGRHLHRSGT